MRRILFALLSLVAPSLSAQGVIQPRICPPPRCAPCLPGRACICVTPPCDMIAPAMIARTASDVRVEFDGRVLRWEVSEKFVNRGGRVAEADYLFPLPDDAAFQDLKLSIGGELVAGETMNATEARQIYEEIVRRQRDPALVEWMGHGLLRARIFPLNPGEEKTVVVRFQSVARREGDAVRVAYFRGARMGDPSAVRTVSRILPDERSSFELVYPNDPTVGRAYSPTHDLDAGERDGHRTARTRSASGEVVVLVPMRRNGGSAAVSVLPYAPGNEAGFALVAVTPPATAPRRTPRDVTFVVDVSGSMSGRKIEQARAAGKQLLATLGPQDRFRVIDFSTDVRSFRDDYVAATAANVAAGSRYLDALDAEGSTNIDAALDAALRGSNADSSRMETIFFVTDGEPTVGERNAERLAARVADRRGARRIFSFGVGSDVNASLVEQIALRGRGTAHFVRPEESVERAVSLVARQVASPVVTDVRVRITCDGATDCARLTRAYPSEPADLFAGQELVMLARYEGSGRAAVEVTGRTADGPVRWTSAALFPERERANSFVARLWATQRVGWLSAEKRRNGGSSEIDAEIRELGERYGIPTEFTSYFVREPGMVATAPTSGAIGNTRGMQLSGVIVAPAAPARAQAFELAERAAKQRSVTTIAAADSSVASGGDATQRRVGTRLFVKSDSGWLDIRFAAGMSVVRVRPFSAAYFALLDAIPELRPAFALGDRVTIVGSHGALALAADGEEHFDAARVREMARNW